MTRGGGPAHGRAARGGFTPPLTVFGARVWLGPRGHRRAGLDKSGWARRFDGRLARFQPPRTRPRAPGPGFERFHKSSKRDSALWGVIASRGFIRRAIGAVEHGATRSTRAELRSFVSPRAFRNFILRRPLNNTEARQHGRLQPSEAGNILLCPVMKRWRGPWPRLAIIWGSEGRRTVLMVRSADESFALWRICYRPNQ